MLACGERSGGGVEKCVWVWGPNTLPHISSLTSPFPTSLLPPPHTNTLSYTSSHTSSHISLPSPIPQHIFLLFPHLPSPSQSVAKLPRDEVSVAKLPIPCGEVTGNRYHYQITTQYILSGLQPTDFYYRI